MLTKLVGSASLAAALGWPVLGTARQAPAHAPLRKTIGLARPEVAPVPILMNSAGASARRPCH